MKIKKKIIVISTILIVFIISIALILFFNISKQEKSNEIISNEKTVQDLTPPIIVLNDTYVVETGYDKDLTEVIMSADDSDRNPKREIIGDYDVNVAGEYNLVYKIEDNNGNITKKDFVLKVKDETSYSENNIEFKDAVKNYKNDDTKIGIDVSKWQEEIDWNKVAKEGIEFAIIRMGYQNGFDGELNIDPYFLKNMDGCKKNHIPVAVYFSSYAKSNQEAKEQAKWVCDNLKSYNYNNLSISFDWENWSSFNKLNLNLGDINNIADTFMNETKEMNYNPILYGSKTYLEAVWKNSNNYQVWLAHYISNTDYQNSYKIWQCCQTGIIDGISGSVDIDIMYKNK